MLKHLFLILSICILFFGCKKFKKTTEYFIADDEIHVGIEGNKYENEIIKPNILDNNAYWASSKRFYIQNINQVEFLINGFSQDELSELIEELVIASRVQSQTDLMFLKYFPQLKRLAISGYMGGNIEAIKFLNNLEVLEIIDGTTVDISPIFELISLKWLSLSGFTKKYDFTAISNLENLETLCLYGIEIEDMSPIYDLPNLKNLIFSWSQEPVDMTHISILKNLEFLELYSLNQNNLNFLINLKKLKTLEIDKFIGNNISPLLQLSSLEELRINYDGSINYMPLATSNSLKKIHFVGWDSYDDWRDFVDNKENIFYENGISTPKKKKIWE
jgi:hypothetical protein